MKILIATDGSDFSGAAIGECLNIVEPASTVFRVVSVWETPPELAVTTYDLALEYYKQAEDAVRAQAQAAIDSAEKQIKDHFAGNTPSITTALPSGPPDKVIIEEAKKWGADLIVVGSHGRGFWGRLLGSVSTGVLHHAPCSVLVGRRRADDQGVK